jgi:L-aspartate semialdehyde sulfurtransferase ferredoxin
MQPHRAENERLEDDPWYRWQLFKRARRVTSTEDSTCIQLRLTLLIPVHTQQEPIVARLMTDYGLTVSIFRTVFAISGRPEQLDLKVNGTIEQMQGALAYLKSLDLSIKGKPNPDGDAWYC